MAIKFVKKQKRLRRARLIRYKIKRQAKWRLGVYRSSRHIYAYILTSEGRVLVSTSTLDKQVRQEHRGYPGNIEAAQKVGKRIAMLAKKAGIVKVAFDRAGYKFHGRIAALANAAREAGLEF